MNPHTLVDVGSTYRPHVYVYLFCLPSVETMSGWCIRLARLEGYDEVVKTLATVADYDRILAITHRGDKKEPFEHYHMVIATSTQEKAIRKRMRVLFTKGKGNGHISVKVWDGNDNALSYMFHEDNANANIIVNKGHSQDDVNRYIKLNEDVNVLVNEAKKKASWKLEELAYQHFMETEGPECNPSLFEVGMKIMEIALEKDMYPPQDWLLKAMATKITYKLSKGYDREQMLSWMVKKALRLD